MTGLWASWFVCLQVSTCHPPSLMLLDAVLVCRTLFCVGHSPWPCPLPATCKFHAAREGGSWPSGLALSVCVWFVNNQVFYGSLWDFIKDAGAGALWDIRRDLSNKPQLRALECSKCLKDFLPFITEFYFTFIPVKSCVLLVEISWFRFPRSV